MALTVDDSTMAAAAACLLARERGHEVTLYLNPYQIVARTPYFFTILNLAIDRLVERARQTEPGARWRAPRFMQLRQEVRARLAPLQGQALDAAVLAFLDEWQLDMPEVPPEAGPIDMQALSGLVAAGVQIGNHGWSHADIAAMSAEALWDDISRAQRWLMDATGQRIDTFAVPFGIAIPPPEVLGRLPGICMLVDGARPIGELAPGLVNRLDITDRIVAGARLRHAGGETALPDEKRGWRTIAARLLRRLRA
ncbi:MAG: polysaccharide deacetylase family protein [Devosia sp.]|nr:polysaccharide deacetylase family protein [Devosia sp.]